jgi:hypothetical protein
MSDHLVSIHRQRPVDLLASSERWKKAPTPTAAHPLIVSPSELGAFLRCRTKHNWGYRAQLESRASDPDRGLGLGILTHDIVDHWYQLRWDKRTVKAMAKIAKKMTKAARLEDLSGEQRKLCEAMCIGYAEITATGADNFPTDKAIGLRDVFPEEWFEVPLNKAKTILLRGRFDIRFQPVNDKKAMALAETKTRKDFRDEYIESTLQLTAYLYALWVKFPKRERYTLYFQRMRKQMPSPRVRAPLFDRQEIDRDPEYLVQWAKDTCEQAMDLHDGAVYPNPMDSCVWMCEFKQACLLRGNPADLKHVLKSEFKPREKR